MFMIPLFEPLAAIRLQLNAKNDENVPVAVLSLPFNSNFDLSMDPSLQRRCIRIGLFESDYLF
jgi:hypothetical protein